MKKLFLVIFLSAFVIACEGQAQKLPSSKLAIESVDGKSHEFSVELALTPQQQAYGLMNRTNMPEDHGMLFFFGEEAERSFWMKNTLIPLDMIFVKKDGSIHHIHDSAKPNDLTSVPSNGAVQAVLELNGGMAEKLDIKPGDKVRHVLFGTQ